MTSASPRDMDADNAEEFLYPDYMQLKLFIR
jgi:hypothetical protein